MGRKFVACTICGLTLAKDKLHEHLQNGHKSGLRRVESKFSLTYEVITPKLNDKKVKPALEVAKKPKAKKERSQTAKPKRPVTTRSQAIGHAHARLWG